MKNKVVLDTPYEEAMKSLNKLEGLRVHGDKIRSAVTVRHIGFGLFGPQIITGEVYRAGDTAEICLRVRPSIVRSLLLAVLCIGSMISVALTLAGYCAPIFCLLLALFTVIRIVITAWEMKTCLARFSQNLEKKLKKS